MAQSVSLDRPHFERFQKGTIDREKGIIRDVSVMTIGPVPDRGYFVDRKTLDQLLACCEQYTSGVKVKADHRSGVFATTAYLKNFRIVGTQLKADLHILEADENRDKLIEMADTIPDTFGLSVSIDQELEERDGRLCIRCTGVASVDLVTEPAANPHGLFSQAPVDAKNKDKPMTNEDIIAECSKMIDAKFAAIDARLKKFETTDGQPEEMGKRIASIESAVASARTEFSKQLGEVTAQVVEKVAAEFSKVVGKTIVPPNPTDVAAAANAEAAKTSDGFEALVQKHYAVEKSKTKAMSAAIADDMKATGGKGHQAFLSKGKSVTYEKKAA